MPRDLIRLGSLGMPEGTYIEVCQHESQGTVLSDDDDKMQLSRAVSADFSSSLRKRTRPPLAPASPSSVQSIIPARASALLSFPRHALYYTKEENGSI